MSIKLSGKPSISLLQKLIQGLSIALRDVGDAYYDVRVTEPVLELIEPGIAWVAQGRYGPTLISTNLPIWDVDHHDHNQVDRLADRIGEGLSGYPHSFRLYRTYAGLRVIATSGNLLSYFVDTEKPQITPWFCEMAGFLMADRAYMSIALRQLTSRARLTPKPATYRLNAPATAPENARACRFLGMHGSGTPDPAFKRQIEFHDERTRALEPGDAPLF